MTIQKNISLKIRSALELSNLTLAEFAERLGISRSSLQEYLKEDANPRIDTVELLAEKLGYTPLELMSDMTAGELRDVHKLPKIHPAVRPLAEACHREVLKLSDEMFRLERAAEHAEQKEE